MKTETEAAATTKTVQLSAAEVLTLLEHGEVSDGATSVQMNHSEWLKVAQEVSWK